MMLVKMAFSYSQISISFFIDDGYGEDKNGIPYSLTDLYIDVPKANDFEDFKNLCERQFAAGVGLYFNEKVADKKCEWNI